MKPHNKFIKTNKLKQYKRTVLSIPTDEGDSYKLDINPHVQRYRLIHKLKKLVSQAQITTPYNTCGRSRTVCTDGECWGLWARHSSARIESRS